MRAWGWEAASEQQQAKEGCLSCPRQNPSSASTTECLLVVPDQPLLLAGRRQGQGWDAGGRAPATTMPHFHLGQQINRDTPYHSHFRRAEHRQVGLNRPHWALVLHLAQALFILFQVFLNSFPARLQYHDCTKLLVMIAASRSMTRRLRTEKMTDALNTGSRVSSKWGQSLQKKLLPPLQGASSMQRGEQQCRIYLLCSAYIGRAHATAP